MHWGVPSFIIECAKLASLTHLSLLQLLRLLYAMLLGQPPPLGMHRGTLGLGAYTPCSEEHRTSARAGGATL